MSLLHEFSTIRPVGGFDLIMADPPWRFDNWSAAGEEKNPIAHYDCTPLEWICDLPVSALAARDCLLWLWATNPMLPQALQALSRWGFEFKTAGTWIKRTTHGKDAFGTGYLLRTSNEPFLLGTIGSPKTTRSTRSTRSTLPTYDDGFHSIADGGDWPKGSITIEGLRRGHSEKPEEGFKAAEGLIPDAQRIELFSRTNRAGWRSWGDEVGKLGDAT